MENQFCISFFRIRYYTILSSFLEPKLVTHSLSLSFGLTYLFSILFKTRNFWQFRFFQGVYVKNVLQIDFQEFFANLDSYHFFSHYWSNFDDSLLKCIYYIVYILLEIYIKIKFPHVTSANLKIKRRYIKNSNCYSQKYFKEHLVKVKNSKVLS